jgi:hypothetical protein
MTTPLTKFVSVSTALATKVVAAETLGIGLFLGCDETIKTLGTVPIDTRWLLVTSEDYADYLDDESEEYAYATAYFSQDYKPQSLIIGRHVAANTAPYNVLSGGSTDYTDYTSTTTGALGFIDSDGNEDDVTGISFAGCTSYAQVLGKCNTALAALDLPNIPRLESCSLVLDNLGRLVLTEPGTADSPFTVLSDCVQTYASYTGVTDGKVKFQDSAGNVVELSSLSFSGKTTFAAVLGVINTALGVLSTPAIVGLETASLEVSNAGEVYLKLTTTGASAPTVTIIAASATGTDLRNVSYLGTTVELHTGEGADTGSTARTISLQAAGSGVDLFTDAFLADTQHVYSGTDAESITTALQLIEELCTFYNVGTYTHGVAGCPNDAAYIALAQYVETQRYQLDIISNETDFRDSTVTDDLASDIAALSLTRTTIYYTEKVGEKGDGANVGYVLPQKPGSCSFAYNPLSGVSESGYSKTLTAAEMATLDTKHVLYFCTVGGVTFVYKSLTSSGEEKRLILGIDWFDITCQTDIINARLTNKVFTYDYNTFGIIESILYKNAKEAALRNIIYAREDKDYPFVVTMPEPTDFSQAVKKTHVFEAEIYSGTVKSEILNWIITGRFTI